jgi:Fibrillar collagen C-terminal domain
VTKKKVLLPWLQFTYKADSNQISFLQMLSSSASQNITYHCFNSLAYYSAKKDHYRKAVSLMSWNDLEIRGRGRLSYEAPVDDCQARLCSFASYF